MNEFKLIPKLYNWQLWRDKITPPTPTPPSPSGGGNLTLISGTINMNSIVLQTIGTIPNGTYIFSEAYITNASTNLINTPVAGLVLSNSGVAPSFSTAGTIAQSFPVLPCPPPGCLDPLPNLFVPENYLKLENSSFCFPPPCNSYYILQGGETISAILNTAAGIPATAKLDVIMNKIG